MVYVRPQILEDMQDSIKFYLLMMKIRGDCVLPVLILKWLSLSLLKQERFTYGSIICTHIFFLMKGSDLNIYFFPFPLKC